MIHASVIENYFSYFPTKTYVVGTQKPVLKHMFKALDKKIVKFYAQKSLLVWIYAQ